MGFIADKIANRVSMRAEPVPYEDTPPLVPSGYTPGLVMERAPAWSRVMAPHRPGTASEVWARVMSPVRLLAWAVLFITSAWWIAALVAVFTVLIVAVLTGGR